MRQVVTGIGLLILLTGSPSLHAQSTDSVGVAKRAAALNELLAARFSRIRDGVSIDACSLYFALRGSPDFRERIVPWLRERVQGEVTAACAERPFSRRDQSDRWYFSSMEGAGTDTLIVTAFVNSNGSHRERYTLHHAPERISGWSLEEISLSQFAFD